MSNQITAIVLGAGKGTRMKSPLPKVLNEVGGQPMIKYVLEAVQTLKPAQTVVVIGPGMPEIEAVVAPYETVVQTEQLGTAHAVLAARTQLENAQGPILILFGDTPLITQETLAEMVTSFKTAEKTAVVVLSMEPHDMADYGRVVLGADGLVEKIVEFKEATDAEKAIPLCNSGVMALHPDMALDLLDAISNDNTKREYYLTDVVEIARKKGHAVSHVLAHEEEVLGVNTKMDLAYVESLLQDFWRYDMMAQGVTLQDPQTVYFSHDTKIAPGVRIDPSVYFSTGVRIEAGSHIKAFSHLKDAYVGKNCVVGPFARLRPGTHLEDNVGVGNFMEIKNSRLKKGVKANHLSYLGDAEIDEGTNIGAGTITCNYDGYRKHKTTIGKDVFIGSNSALVAPVAIGDGAIIGAGSTVTQDVDPDELVVARAFQKNMKEGAQRFRQKAAASKK